MTMNFRGIGASEDSRPSRPAPDRPASLVQWVADIVTERIIRQDYAEGQHLREMDLATELGVSRSPIREALRVLEQHGVIELLPYRGPVVTTITEKMVSDIYRLRVYLSKLVYELACPKLSQDDLARLRSALGEMESAVEAEDLDAYFAGNVKFHDLIYQRTGNDELLRVLISLRSRVLRLRYLSLSLPSRAQLSLIRHRMLLKALEAGDVSAASRAPEVHLEESRQAIIHYLRSRERATG